MILVDREESIKYKFFLMNDSIIRIFDEIGDGFISVEKFKVILKQIDEDFTDQELEDVILEVLHSELILITQHFFRLNWISRQQLILTNL